MEQGLNKEILSRTFALAQNPLLRFVSKTFYSLSKQLSVRADYVLAKFGTKEPFDTHAGVQIKCPFPFTEDLALTLLHKSPFAKEQDEGIFVYAIENGWESVVSRILNTFTKQPRSKNASAVDINTKAPSEETSICLSVAVDINCGNGVLINTAIKNNRYKIAEQLVNAYKISPSITGASSETIQFKGHEKLDLTTIRNSDIGDMVENNKNKLMELLCCNGLDLQLFRYSFIQLCRNGSFGMIKLLIDDNDDLRAFYGEALVESNRLGHFEIFQYLIERGADVQVLDDKAFISSCSNGYIELVKHLIELGADVHAQDNKALALACQNGNTEMVKYLIEHGADIHAQDSEAFIWACLYGHTEIVKYLVKHGADIRARDNEALISTCRYGYTGTIKYLVEIGADIYAQGGKPLRNARNAHHTDIIKYLEKIIPETGKNVKGKIVNFIKTVTKL